MAARKIKLAPIPQAKNPLFGQYIQAEEIVGAYKELFATPQGQIVLADLMHRFSYNSESLYPDTERFPRDEMLRRDGRRDVVIYVGMKLSHDPVQADDTQTTEM